jgi:hypothetical protein
MMNGICCYYQNEQQETMRREMRTEYQHILYQQHFGSAPVSSPRCSVHHDHANSSPAVTTRNHPIDAKVNKTHLHSVEEYHRRRKLFLDKSNAWNHSQNDTAKDKMIIDTEEDVTECSSCPTVITPEASSHGDRSESSIRRTTRGWGMRNGNQHSSTIREVSMSSIPDQPSNDNFAVSLNACAYGETEGIEMELIESSSMCDDDAPFENIPL